MERAVGQTARHIEKFFVECYRGLKDLQLEGLNDINILTGNNNSGKTSVLELISSLVEPENILTWIKMCRLNGDTNYYTGILNLFPPGSEYAHLRYVYGTEYCNCDIALQAQIREERILEGDIDRINNAILRDEFEKKGGNYIETKCVDLLMYVDGQKINSYEIYDFQTRLPIVRSFEKSIPAIYVSPSAHTNGKIFLDDVMESTELYQDMMKILNEFDDSIINIIKSGNGAEYMILSRKHKKAMPLSVYGDGMKKALVLLAAVTKAKNGILLLDEFETAIHTSAMNNIFSMILQSAQKLNVQVFLSSHSLEAIGKVLRCAPELQDKINLYTLYNKEGKSLVRKMSCKEAIKAQDDWGVELR